MLQIQPMRAYLLECKDNPGLCKYSKVHNIDILLYYFSTKSYISGFVHEVRYYLNMNINIKTDNIIR